MLPNLRYDLICVALVSDRHGSVAATRMMLTDWSTWATRSCASRSSDLFFGYL